MSDATHPRPHRRQLRRRTACDDDEDDDDGKSTAQDTAEAARLDALRSMQRMRGTRQYRATQLDVLRHTSEPDTRSGSSGGANSTTPPPPPPPSADPQDITDHTKQMFVLLLHTFKTSLDATFHNTTQGRVHCTEAPGKTRWHSNTSNSNNNKSRRR